MGNTPFKVWFPLSRERDGGIHGVGVAVGVKVGVGEKVGVFVNVSVGVSVGVQGIGVPLASVHWA